MSEYGQSTFGAYTFSWRNNKFNKDNIKSNHEKKKHIIGVIKTFIFLQRGCFSGGGDKTVKLWQFELIEDSTGESKAKVTKT